MRRVSPDPTLAKTFWWNSKSDKGLQMSYGESSPAVSSVPPSPLRGRIEEGGIFDHPLPLLSPGRGEEN